MNGKERSIPSLEKFTNYFQKRIRVINTTLQALVACTLAGKTKKEFIKKYFLGGVQYFEQACEGND